MVPTLAQKASKKSAIGVIEGGSCHLLRWRSSTTSVLPLLSILPLHADPPRWTLPNCPHSGNRSPNAEALYTWKYGSLGEGERAIISDSSVGGQGRCCRRFLTQRVHLPIISTHGRGSPLSNPILTRPLWWRSHAHGLGVFAQSPRRLIRWVIRGISGQTVG